MANESNEEQARLRDAAEGKRAWRRWGPYLSERQWGTVREDYSAGGDAWSFFPHDHARSRAYRWGEDGLLGICDENAVLCFALALWNGSDPILKERLFGLTNPQGNHGEDVKECYYYLDALPSAAYLRALYKYPQARFPYQHLIDENQRRGKSAPEYELLDTGIFDGNRYFDAFVEYGKAQPDDICIRITLHNRGPERAELHVLPTLWFRNTWSWQGGYEAQGGKPLLRKHEGSGVVAEHSQLGRYLLAAGPGPRDTQPTWLFTENETNSALLYGDPRGPRHAKDAFHQRVVEGRRDAVSAPSFACACTPKDTPAPIRWAARMRTCSRSASVRPSNSTAGSRCRRTRRRCGRPPPGSSGPNSSTTTRFATGYPATRSFRRPRRASAAATPTGGTCSRAT
jgi:hypothetical protein